MNRDPIHHQAPTVSPSSAVTTTLYGDPEEKAVRSAQHREVLTLGTDWPHLFDEPRAVQIDSPDRLPPTLLARFQWHEKQILCLNREQRIVRADLTASHGQELAIRVDSRDALKIQRWQGRPVVVVFPTDDGRQYCLQTQVQSLTLNEVRLVCQDPRYTPRYDIALEESIHIWEIRPQVLLDLVQGCLDVVRDTHWDSPEPKQQTIVGLEDNFRGKADQTTLCTADSIDESAVTEGLPINISLGGICVVYQGQPLPAEWRRKLFLLDFSLPQVDHSGSDPARRIALKLFILVRGVETRDQHIGLHCQFLHPLPEAFSAHLQLLETGQAPNDTTG